MSDLVWVGNTLLPRWIVFAVPVAIIMIPYMIVIWPRTKDPSK